MEADSPSPTGDNPERGKYPPLLIAITALWWLLVIAALFRESNFPEYFGRYSQLYLILLLLMIGAGIVLTLLLRYSVKNGVPRFLSSLRSFFLLACFTVVFGLLTVEVLIRSLDLLGASFYREISHYIMDLEADPHTVFRHRADHRAEYQGVGFQTNEMGLRDGPVLPREEDEFRILALGDSVTLGWGVEAQDVFISQLQERLSEQLGRPVRIINTGVCGYNTAQELAYLLNYGLAMEPDALLLTYVDNDVEPEPIDIEQARQQWNEPEGANALLTRYSWTYRIYFHILPYLLNMKQLEVDPQQFRASERALTEIAQIAQQRDLPLMVAFFRLTHSERGDLLAEMLTAHAEANGYRYVDLLPLFTDRDIRQLTNSVIDVHPNADGHRLMADAIEGPLIETYGLASDPGGG